jgi:rare lipoprotein A
MAETWHCRASWYGPESGSVTANGERFHPDGLTAASRTLPFGSYVRVTYKGKSVMVRVNDVGPAKWTGRCIDLSRGAAKAIGLTKAGVGVVTITVIGK